MQIKYFPNCCTAQVLVGFGQTETADWAIRPNNNELSVGKIKARLGQQLNQVKNLGHAVCTAITNDEQVNANQALEECGFLSSDWMTKENHPETKLKLWWFPVNDKQING
jgi:hypothetical protein